MIFYWMNIRVLRVSHFLDLEFISINTFLTEVFCLYLFKSLEGISSHPHSITPSTESPTCIKKIPTLG